MGVFLFVFVILNNSLYHNKKRQEIGALTVDIRSKKQGLECLTKPDKYRVMR